MKWKVYKFLNLVKIKRNGGTNRNLGGCRGARMTGVRRGGHGTAHVDRGGEKEDSGKE